MRQGWAGKARPGLAGFGRRGEARFVPVRRGEVRYGAVGFGRRGVVCPGEVGPVRARMGMAGMEPRKEK